MYTELLIAIPLLFIIINIAIITELLVIRRKQYNHTAITLYRRKIDVQPHFTLLDNVLIVPVKREPLLLTGLIQDYQLAQRFISYTIKGNRKDYFNKSYELFDYSYLIDYLSYHLVKYPNGKLPQQSATITYYDNKLQATMNFYDATDTRCEKYVKQAMKLLKIKKTKVKQLDILTEADKIVKSKGKRTVKGRTVKLKKYKVTDNKMLEVIK